jgi:hypothetical protein
VSIEHGGRGIVNLIETNRSVGTEESVWHGVVLEESACNGQVELTIGNASIYEEEEWKYCFGVCGKITRCDEGKFGIGGDGILDLVISEFPSNRSIVLTSSKSIAEIGELYG